MKLAEFNALCEREWGEARGDVLRLHLTDDSYEELTRDALGHSVDDHEPAVAAVVNPVTRSAVKVAGGASADLAEVRRYYASPHPAGICE